MKLSNALLCFFAFAEGAQLAERTRTLRLRRQAESAPVDAGNTVSGEDGDSQNTVTDNTQNKAVDTVNQPDADGDVDPENGGAGPANGITATDDGDQTDNNSDAGGDETKNEENKPTEKPPTDTTTTTITTTSDAQTTICAVLLLALGQMLL